MNLLSIFASGFLSLALLVFVGMLAEILVDRGMDPRRLLSPLIGKSAPPFSLPVLNDPSRTLSNADLLGKVSLVNVWASWCPSCRAEQQELMRLAREERDIQILGLNWKDGADDAIRVLRQSGDPYAASAFDPDDRTGIPWGIAGAPETFLVDPAGIVRFKQMGPIDRQVWEALLKPMVQRIKAES